MGFLQRLRAGSYHFIEESFELKQGLLYYLYFKDVVKKNRIGNGNPSLVSFLCYNKILNYYFTRHMVMPMTVSLTFTPRLKHKLTPKTSPTESDSHTNSKNYVSHSTLLNS